MKAEDAETKHCPFCFNNPDQGFNMRCISHCCMAWTGNKNEGNCSLIPNALRLKTPDHIKWPDFKEDNT
jgi:hypothetical protein